MVEIKSQQTEKIEEKPTKIYVDGQRYEEIIEEFPGYAQEFENLIERKLERYRKTPFNNQTKRLFLDKIKEEITFYNPNFEEEPEQRTSGKKQNGILIQELTKEEIIEDIKTLLLMKKRQEATETITSWLERNNFIYTTKEDLKSEIWIYKEGVYKPQGESEMKEQARKLLGHAYTTHLVNEVINKIKADTFIEPKEFFENNYIGEIPVENGILNIFTKELKGYNPRKIFFNKLPVCYNPSAECPKIESFLRDILSKEEDIKLFYELCGFCLLKEYRFEKAFMFVGDGRNGKDKSLELIKRLIGVENCCSVPLSALEPDSFIISEFFGKMVNIAGEISNQDLKDTIVFKGLTGRSFFSAPRKFLKPISFVNYSKFIFACNELPMVYDSSKGFWDRWVLLEFPYTFVTKTELESEKEMGKGSNYKIRDENIIEKITTKDELSGFLNKCLEGLSRLIKQKDFSTTLGSKEIKDIWIRRSNSVLAFCLDNLEEDYQSLIPKREFKKKYVEYCKKHQVKPKTDYIIKRTLAESFGVSEEYSSVVPLEPRQIWCWTGIKWRENNK